MSEVLGLLFAVIVGLSFVPTLSRLSQTASDNTRATTTAQQQKKLIDASTQYIQQYSANVQSVATATSPAVITVPMLQAVHLLDASFSATNPFGQTWQTEVLQPSAGNLQAFVMTYGGPVMNDMIASKIASLVGQPGGFIPKNDSGAYAGGAATAYGAYGGWTQATANYSSISGGHLAALLTFNNGQLTSNYLYRNAVPGQPQVNRMGTAIDMGGNNLNNAGTVNAQTATISGNANVTGNVTANGSLVGAAGRINAWNNATEGGVISMSGANGVVMHVENINGTWRLVNSPWNAQLLAVDQNGNTSTAGRLTSGEYLQPGGWASAGAGCSPNGLVGHDGNGPLFCKNGIWVGSGGVSSVTYSDSGGWQPAAIAYCPAGYTLTGGSCDMYQAGDGREISPRTCAPAGNNSYYCSEGNGGYCIAHAVCAQ